MSNHKRRVEKKVGITVEEAKELLKEHGKWYKYKNCSGYMILDAGKKLKDKH